MADPVGATLAARDALSPSVELIILGGLAANVYRGIGRLTQDADLLLVVEARPPSEIERDLVAAGFRRPPGPRKYRAGRFEWRRLVWPSPDEETIVDLFFSGADRHSAAFLRCVAARAVPTMLRGRSVKAVTPEDLIVFKALALASGTRGPKTVTDQDDVRSILDNRTLSLDLEYLRKMASSVGVLRVVTRFLPKPRNGRG